MSLILPCAREGAGSPPSLFPDYRSTVPRSPRQPALIVPQTLTETTGPADAWPRLMGGAMADLATRHKGEPRGQRIVVSGRVLDESGRPVPNTVVEIWQANAAGRYASPDDAREDVPLDEHFVGLGRAATDKDGLWRFRTVRPGRVPGLGNTLQAPHVALSVFGRGLLRRLATRLYFADGEGNDRDLILSLVPDERRHILLAERKADGTWWIDIRLQGENETVFFDL